MRLEIPYTKKFRNPIFNVFSSGEVVGEWGRGGERWGGGERGGEVEREVERWRERCRGERGVEESWR
jgi:hypothetical protein